VVDESETMEQSRQSRPVLFDGKSLKFKTPADINARVQGAASSQESVSRALKHKAFEGDIYVATPPRCGEGLLLAMLQFLSFGEGSVDAKGNRTSSGQHYEIPWLESKEFDANPRALDELQPGRFRLYKTHMDYQALADKIEVEEAKFITVLRDPKDYRLSWFRYLSQLYEFERNHSTNHGAFLERFKADDFALLNPCFCHGYMSDPTYEANLLEWIQHRSRPNVLVVFYEDIINDTPSVLDELARFLGFKLSSSFRESILMHTNFTKMQAEYSQFHEFNVEDAKTGVGAGVQVYSFQTNVRLNQQWNFIVRSPYPQYKDYRELYQQVTGREYPFDYQLQREQEDLLCANLSQLFKSCLPSKKED